MDVTARAVAEEARHDLGNIIVENKPGAGGNIGVDYVAKQAPDGKTIVMGALATHAVNPNLFSKLPYDPIKDFTPITLIAQTPNVLVITPEFSQKTGIKSVKDLIEYAKKNPDAINYASGGNGSAGHMSGELLKNATGIKIVHIPFKGAAAAQMSVLSGDTQMIFDNLNEGYIDVMPAINETAQIWTPGESFLIDLCTDAFRLSRGEAELYETIEKIQQGLERMVQQIFDAIHTLA